MSSEPSLSGECSLLRLRTCDLNRLGWLAPAGMSTVIAPQFPHSRSDCRRTQCDVLHPERPGERNLLEPVETAANGASTLRAVRVTAKNTWLHASAQISRIVRRHFRKYARRRRNRRPSVSVG